MNRSLQEIEESAEVLQALLRQEPRSRQKQRLHALYLLKSGQAQSRTHVGQLLGVGRRAVGDWLWRYEQEGLDGLLEIRTHTNRQRALSDDQETQLQEKLAEPEGFASYGAIQAWVKETFGVSLPYTTVYSLVHDRMKAKLKVARKSHTKKPASP
jgi:transposase